MLMENQLPEIASEKCATLKASVEMAALPSNWEQFPEYIRIEEISHRPELQPHA
jgi:hypothetical protein